MDDLGQLFLPFKVIRVVQEVHQASAGSAQLKKPDCATEGKRMFFDLTVVDQLTS